MSNIQFSRKEYDLNLHPTRSHIKTLNYDVSRLKKLFLVITVHEQQVWQNSRLHAWSKYLKTFQVMQL